MRIGRCRYIQDGRGPGDLDCGITGASVGDDCGASRGMGPGDDGAGCLPRQVLHYARGERQGRNQGRGRCSAARPGS